jgi:hypothetical protein
MMFLAGTPPPKKKPKQHFYSKLYISLTLDTLVKAFVVIYAHLGIF